METITYGIKEEVNGGFEAVEKEVRKALQAEGFGVLTEINVQAALREKIGKSTPKHLILGACNPAKAYEALAREHDISLLLPCNIILYEGDGVTPGSENNTVTVAAIRPSMAMSMVENESVSAIAKEIEEKLVRVIRAIENEQPENEQSEDKE